MKLPDFNTHERRAFGKRAIDSFLDGFNVKILHITYMKYTAMAYFISNVDGIGRVGFSVHSLEHHMDCIKRDVDEADERLKILEALDPDRRSLLTAPENGETLKR